MSSRYPASSMNRPYYAPNSGSGISRNVVEDENSRLTEELSSKVRQLKSMTIDFGDEVKGQRGLLDGLAHDFERSGGLLGATMGRLTRMANSPGSFRTILYTFLFAFGVFFMCWIMYKFKS